MTVANATNSQNMTFSLKLDHASYGQFHAWSQHEIQTLTWEGV